ncbi:MAG: SDR family NAD(P)-dependent oxidoreductase [Candidatus Hodarchaeota archaeon]
MKELRNKNCLITGAASGIGRCLAIELAKEGMNLLISDIDTQNLEKVKEEIEAIGAKVHSKKCDVSNLGDIQSLANEFYQKLGDVDLLINNAGTAGGGSINDIELDEWRKVLEVNLWSVIYAIKVFLPKMLERGSGHFVNTGSAAGIIGLPFHPHYVASKFAVSGLTEALYSELYDSGINFSVICPTRVRTNIDRTSPMTINPRFLTETDSSEIEKKLKIFREKFSVEFFKKGIDPDIAAKRYIKGIKKNKLYIFDKKILNIALFIKGISLQRGWRRILQRQSKEDFSAIETSLVESGLSTKEYLEKIFGKRVTK